MVVLVHCEGATTTGSQDPGILLNIPIMLSFGYASTNALYVVNGSSVDSDSNSTVVSGATKYT